MNGYGQLNITAGFLAPRNLGPSVQTGCDKIIEQIFSPSIV
jgi:hypothetical protein